MQFLLIPSKGLRNIKDIKNIDIDGDTIDFLYLSCVYKDIDDEFKKSLCNSCGKIINNMTPEKFNILISKSIESKNLEPMGDN